MYRNLLFGQPVDLQQQAFYNTPLGELYQAIPFESFSKHIPKPKQSISGEGCKPWFDVKGGIGSQVLKPYDRCSDALLVEQINGNWQMDLFCGILLLDNEHIKDKDMVGRWRSYPGQHLDRDKLQLDCEHTGSPSCSTPIRAIVMPLFMRAISNTLPMQSCCGSVLS